MADEYDNELKGALWVVPNPESDRHPNMTGSVTVDGVEYWLSGWATRNPEGRRPNIRLALKAKQPKGPSHEPPEQPADFGDQIPF